MSQFDLFSATKSNTPVAQTPDPDAIRERLNAVLEQLRTADHMPWKPQELRSWRHVFHNMANWLPEEEREKLRQDFTVEITRLESI